MGEFSRSAGERVDAELRFLEGRIGKLEERFSGIPEGVTVLMLEPRLDDTIRRVERKIDSDVPALRL